LEFDDLQHFERGFLQFGLLVNIAWGMYAFEVLVGFEAGELVGEPLPVETETYGRFLKAS
jgi:hypothetical protein